MVTPLQSLRLPIGHPLVEILCKLSLNNKAAFNEEAPINFKKEVSEEEKIKFKQALRSFMRLLIMRLLQGIFLMTIKNS